MNIVFPVYKNNIVKKVLNKGQKPVQRAEKYPNFLGAQCLSEQNKAQITKFTPPKLINTTSMFREDVNWMGFLSYLKGRFKDNDKVNTYIYGCSNGSEPYTMSVLFKKGFNNPEKFYPIIAKDLDEELIDDINKMQDGIVALPIRAQNQYTTISDLDERAQEALNLSDNDLKKYFEKMGDYVAINKEVREPIKFSSADILKDIDSIDSDNPSIVMTRNMWPYIDCSKYQEYADSLYEKLAPNSVVVLGHYDFIGDDGDYIFRSFANCLKKAGFTPSKFPIGRLDLSRNLVFEKN